VQILFCTKTNKCIIISQIITIIIGQNTKIKKNKIKTMKSLPASSVTCAHAHTQRLTSMLRLARESHMIVAMHTSHDTQPHTIAATN